jgi:hypothetical protein
MDFLTDDSGAMKTVIEVRLSEKWANDELGASVGEPMGERNQPPYARRVVLEVGDPLLDDLKARLSRTNYRPAVLVDREYTASELSTAELFQLVINEYFHRDACGEDYGTEYDDSSACPRCGAGRLQLSPLRLDLSLVRKGVDVVRTIAIDELVVSQRFLDLLGENHVTGYFANEVEHVGKAKAKGRWYQLSVTGRVGETVNPTRFGIGYFEDDSLGSYVCPEHKLSGLHLISEAFVRRQTLENVDIALTDNRVGMRSGVVMPTPIIVVTPRFVQFVTANGIRGVKLEIVHIVD